jgi:hypothetical protein
MDGRLIESGRSVSGSGSLSSMAKEVIMREMGQKKGEGNFHNTIVGMHRAGAGAAG